MAALVNAAIPFFVGIYVLLVGFRVVGKKPGVDPKFDEFHERFGTLFKVLGVACLVLSVVYLIIDTRKH